ALPGGLASTGPGPLVMHPSGTRFAGDGTLERPNEQLAVGVLQVHQVLALETWLSRIAAVDAVQIEHEDGFVTSEPLAAVLAEGAERPFLLAFDQTRGSLDERHELLRLRILRIVRTAERGGPRQKERQGQQPLAIRHSRGLLSGPGPC